VSRIRKTLTSGIAVVAMMVSGCYEFLPPPERTTELTGKRVELTLTDAGSVVLASAIGPQMESVGGTLVDLQQDNLVVSVLSVTNRNGIETGWRGEHIEVPRSMIARVAERRFSARRTFFASAALIAGLVIAQRAFGGAGGANSPGNGVGVPGSPR
jgi:hypothetical protein